MLTITLILVLTINSIYQDTNRYANQNYELIKFENVPNDIEFANFGSSHGQLGFYYPHEDIVTFNFALSSQAPEYDLALLKENLDHFAEDAVVIFPISYFTPYLFSHEDDFEFEVRNQRYYNILRFNNIISFNLIELIKAKIQPLNGRDIFNYHAIIEDDSMLEELTYSNGNFPLSNWGDDNTMNNKNLYDEAVVRWDYWKIFRANLDLKKTGSYNSEIINIYKEIVRICKENQITPVFVTLPVTSELNMVVDSDFYPIFEEDMVSIMNEIGNPTYFDYSHQREFKSNLKYFIDTDHLSKAGAVRFTEILMEDVEKATSKQLIIENYLKK